MRHRLSGTILIIDDHEDTRRIYGAILRFGGFGVAEAADGPAGLRLVAEARPTLVVLDVLLPGTSGYEVLSEIRRQEATRALPVICVSANAFSRNVEEAYLLGCNLYLTKPLAPRELLEQIRSVLNGSIRPREDFEPSL